jgi:hypothetical protein
MQRRDLRGGGVSEVVEQVYILIIHGFYSYLI